MVYIWTYELSIIYTLRSVVPIEMLQAVRDVRTAAADASDLFRDLRSVSPQFEGTFSQLQSLIENANSGITSARAWSEKLLTSLFESLTSFSTGNELLLRLSDILILCVDFLMAFINKSILSFTTCVARTARLFTQSVVDWVTKFVSTYNIRSSTERGVAQSAMPFASLLVGLIGAGLSGFLPDINKMRRVNESLKTFSLLHSMAGKFEEVVVQLVEFLPALIQTWIYELFPEFKMPEYFEQNGKYRIWIDRVHQLDTPPIHMRLTWDKELQDEIELLYKNGLDYVVEFGSDTRRGPRLIALMMKTSQVCHSLYSKVKASTLNRGRKREPFHISLAGKPGAGKSVLANIIAEYLYPDVPKENRVWCRNSAVRYWEGYSQQKVIMFDDFGQSKLNNGETNCFVEMIGLVSSTATPLPFANLDSKQIVFDSPCIITTTNDAYPAASDSLREAKAYWRRRHILAYVAADDSVTDKDGIIISSKLKDGTSHYRFHIADPLDSSRLLYSTVLDLKSFLQYIKREFDSHTDRQEALFNSVTDFENLANQDINKLVWPIKGGQITNLHGRNYHSEAAIRAARECFNSSARSSIANLSVSEISALASEKASEMLVRPDSGLDDNIYAETIFPDRKSVTNINVKCKGRAQMDIAGCSNEVFHPALEEISVKPMVLTLSDFETADDDYFEAWAGQNLNQPVAAGGVLSKEFWNRALLPLRKFLEEHSILAQLLKYTLILTPLAAGLGAAFLYFRKETKEKLVAEAAAQYDPAGRRVRTVKVRSVHSVRRGRAQVKYDAKMKSTITQMCSSGADVHDVIKLLRDCSVSKMDIKRVMTDFSLRAESAVDINASTILSTIVARNGGNLYLAGARVNVIGLCGSKVLGPKHLFAVLKDLNDTPQMTLELNNGTQFKVLFDRNNLCELPDEDLFIYDFGRRLHPFKDIVPNFIKESDLSNHTSFPGVLVVIDTITASRVQHAVNVKALTVPREYDAYSPNGVVPYVVHSGWMYGCATVLGDCGGVLVAFDSRLPRKLVGIHVCAFEGSNMGLSVLVTQERLLDLLSRMRAQAQCGFGYDHELYERPLVPLLDEFDEDTGCYFKVDRNLCDGVQLPADFNLFPIQQAKIIPGPNCILLGAVNSRYSSRMPTKTAIHKSILYDQVFEHTMEPSVLSPNDPRLQIRVSPLLAGVNKYCDPVEPIPYSFLAECVLKPIGEFIVGKESHVQPRIFSEYEAINGIPGFEFVDAINMATSAGFPYTDLRPIGEVGKGYLFTEGEGKEVRDPLLRARLDRREKMALCGQRIISVWVDHLKDEKRPMEKIIVGKTRVFTVGPVDFTIIAKRYMGAFVAHLYSDQVNNFSAVGINAFSKDWHLFTMKLLENSPLGFDGDYGNFDGSIWPELIDFVTDVMNAWYKDHASQVRVVLGQEMAFTTQLAMNCMYVVLRGNPSGCPITTLINVIVNYVFLVFSWMSLAPPAYASFYHFRKNVWVKLFGDDNIVSVKQQCLEWYNLHTVSDHLGRYGVKYTGSNKISDIKETPAFGRITEMKFLKSGFRQEGFLWKPVLERSVIQELIQWYREPCPDKEAALCENVDCALRFMYFYGQNEFRSFRSKIIKTLKELGVIAEFVDFRYLDNWYLFGKSLFDDLDEMEVHGVAQCAFSDSLMGQHANNLFEMSLLQPQNSFAMNCNVLLYEDNQMARGVAQSDTGGASAIITGEAVDPHVKLGIVLEEQRPVHHEDGSRGLDLVPMAMADNYLHDAAWDLMRMVSRPTFIGTYKWPSSGAGSTPRSNLVSFQVPYDLIISALNIAPFANFKFFRCESINIKVQLNATRFQAGKLLATYVPLTNKNTVANWHWTNFAAATSVPHFFLDASSSSTAELSIPFVHPQGYLSISLETTAQDVEDALQYLGYFSVNVFNQLRVGAAGASDSAVFSVFAEIVGAQFKVPRPSTQTRVRGIAQGGVASTTYNIDNRYAKVGDMTLPAETTGDAFDAGRGAKVDVSAMGMDKPSWTINPLAIYRRALPYLAHSRNIETTDRLTFDPSSQNLCSFEHFGTKEDQMSMRYLTGLPTWYWTFQWTTANVANTLLLTGLVGPFSNSLTESNGIVLASGSVVAPLFEVTLLDYVSMPFSFWRGAIDMKISIAATGFHTGRLWVGFHPGETAAATTIEASLGQFGVMIDLQDEAREWHVSFPFLSPTPWKRVPHGPPAIAEFASLDTILTFVTGVWSIRVVNPLIVPDNVTGTIDVNVFLSGGSDYELAYPGNSNTSVVPYNPFVAPSARGVAQSQRVRCNSQSRRRRVRLGRHREPSLARTNFDGSTCLGICSFNLGRGIAQMATEGVTQVDMRSETAMVGATLSAAPGVVRPDRHFGERISSVRDCLKRFFVLDQITQQTFSRDNTVSDTFGNSAYFAISSYLSTVPVMDAIPQYWPNVGSTGDGANQTANCGLLGWFGILYRFWRGGMRFKFIQDGNGDSLCRMWTTFDPDVNFALNTDQVGTLLSTNVQNLAVQSTMPFSAPSAITAAFGSADQKATVTQGKSLPLAYDGSDWNSPFCEVEVPFQTQYNILRTGIESPNPYSTRYHRNNILYNAAGQVLSGFSTVTTTRGIRTFTVFQSIADDFRMSFLLGPPSCHLRGILSTQAEVHTVWPIVPDAYTPVVITDFDIGSDLEVLSQPDSVVEPPSPAPSVTLKGVSRLLARGRAQMSLTPGQTFPDGSPLEKYDVERSRALMIPSDMNVADLFNAYILVVAGPGDESILRRSIDESTIPIFARALLVNMDPTKLRVLVEVAATLFSAVSETNKFRKIHDPKSRYTRFCLDVCQGDLKIEQKTDYDTIDTAFFHELVASRFNTHPEYSVDKITGEPPNEVFLGRIVVRGQENDVKWTMKDVSGRSMKEVRARLSLHGLLWMQACAKESATMIKAADDMISDFKMLETVAQRKP